MTHASSTNLYAGAPGPCGDAGYEIIAAATPAGDPCDVLAGGADAPVARNPHLHHAAIVAAVRAPVLLEAVAGRLGPAVAVENTFLIIKRPGSEFSVPAHQDGINDRLVLDPTRSVTAWLAITPATEANGCLHVLPRSHHGGYAPYGRSSAPGRPLGVLTVGDEPFTAVELAAGDACLMDVRLLHRSGVNHTTSARAGLNIRYVAPGAVHHRCGPTPQLFPVSGHWPGKTD